jgi:hypothetical protein
MFRICPIRIEIITGSHIFILLLPQVVTLCLGGQYQDIQTAPLIAKSVLVKNQIIEQITYTNKPLV